MKPDKIPVLIGWLALVALPFAVWIVLAIIARVWKANLRPLLSWLRSIGWIVCVLGGVLLFAGALSNHFFWTFTGVAIGTCSSGLLLVERWVKRHYAPDLESPYDRWLTMRMR